MAFAGSRWAEEMDGLVTINEAELRQGEDAISVEGGLEGEVETSERLDRCKPAHSQRRLDPAVLAQGQFLGEEDIDGFKGGQFTVLETAHDMMSASSARGFLRS